MRTARRRAYDHCVRRAALITVSAWLAACDCGGETIGELDALLASSTPALEFGEVYAGTARTKTIELASTGAAPIRVSRVSVTDPQFAVDPPEAVIPGGSKRTFTVELRPSAAAGPLRASLRVENDSQNAPQLVIALSGTARAIPDCDDGNPCTEDQFDPEHEQCLHQNHDRPCDDSSACTEGDRCAAGECRGTAIRCEDANECARGFCDPAAGCVLIPDAARCADENPCTTDRCTIEDGCTHEDLPDGATCGEGIECVTGQVCIFGSCREVGVPEGFPCDDEDACTIGDACAAQRCEGTRIIREPALLGSTRTYGLSRPALDTNEPVDRLALAATLPDGRLVFGDWERGPRYASTLTLVVPLNGRLEVVATTTIAGRVDQIEVFPSGALLVVTGNEASGFGSMQIFEPAPSGKFTGRGSAYLPGYSRRIALGAAVAYGCFSWGIAVFDLADADNPDMINFVPGVDACEDVEVDRARERLWVADGTAMIELSLAPDPRTPQLIAEHAEPAGIRKWRVSGDVILALDDQGATFLNAETRAPTTAFDRARPRDIALGDRFAAITSTRGLSLYDTRDPHAPQWLLDWPIGQVRALAADHLLIAHPAIESGSAAVFELELDTATPMRRIAGPGLGASTQFLAPNILVSRDTVHRLDLTDPTQPQYLSSAPFETNAGRALIDVAGRRALASPLRYEDPSASEFFGDVEVVDATNLRAPVPLETVSIRNNGYGITDQNAQLLYLARFDTLEVYDLSAASTGTVAMIGELYLSELSRLAGANAVLSFDATESRLFVAGTSTGFESYVALIDVSIPSLPMLLSSHFYMHRLVRSSTTKDAVSIALEWSDPPWSPVFDYTGAFLHRFERDQNGALQLVQSATISAGRNILAFDGRTAIVSTQNGVLMLDTTTSPPRYRHELALPHTPHALRVAGDHLLLLSESALSVVEPLCPP